MRYRSPENSELIRERIIRIKSELRRLQMELRLAEVERRDRAKFQKPRGKSREIGQ